MLREFDGTLLIVSHDREFLDNVVTSTLVFEKGADSASVVLDGKQSNTQVKNLLKAAFESLGFNNVVTYINSGNVAFDARKSTGTALVNKIAPVVERLAGTR